MPWRSFFFLWTISCCAWGLPLRVLCFSSEMPLEKIHFSFASAHQMEVGLGLEIGTCIHSLRSFRMLSGGALFKSFAPCLSLCELWHTAALLDQESLVSLVMFILSASYTLSVPFPHSSLNFGGWEIWWWHHIYVWVLQGFRLPTHWLAVHLIYCSNGCSRISSNIIILVLSFSITVVFCFPPNPRAI